MKETLREIENSREYSILAEIYDAVMQNVNYEAWSDYIDEIILHHHHEANDLLELACGTGTMALSMEELGYYTITATDLSAEMILKAKQKGRAAESGVRFQTLDFLDINLDRTFDVVYMVFDSLNYLHSTQDILTLHQQVHDVLKPGGLFIYDFTTPRNSKKAIRYLDQEQAVIDDIFSYHRKSSYDHENRIHTNIFDILKKDPLSQGVTRKFREKHQQKIYTMNEIYPVIKESPFQIVKAYDGFELKPAHKRSLRITMVLR